jgi:hypothetical protein
LDKIGAAGAGGQPESMVVATIQNKIKQEYLKSLGNVTVV